jgi:hypothetical protein
MALIMTIAILGDGGREIGNGVRSLGRVLSRVRGR